MVLLCGIGYNSLVYLIFFSLSGFSGDILSFIISHLSTFLSSSEIWNVRFYPDDPIRHF